MSDSAPIVPALDNLEGGIEDIFAASFTAKEIMDIFEDKNTPPELYASVLKGFLSFIQDKSEITTEEVEVFRKALMVPHVRTRPYADALAPLIIPVYTRVTDTRVKTAVINTIILFDYSPEAWRRVREDATNAGEAVDRFLTEWYKQRVEVFPDSALE